MVCIRVWLQHYGLFSTQPRHNPSAIPHAAAGDVTYPKSDATLPPSNQRQADSTALSLAMMFDYKTASEEDFFPILFPPQSNPECRL
jgi:hypothetical protein